MFLYKSVSLFNNLNAHPRQPQVYGTKLMDVAKLDGIIGLRLVTEDHLLLSENTQNHKTDLMYSRIPGRLAVRNLPNHELRIVIDLPKAERKKNKLRRPTFTEIRDAYYELLSVALRGIWHDNSRISSDQIRFVMRVSGLKFRDPDQLKRNLKIIRKKLQNNLIDPQLSLRDLQMAFAGQSPDKLALMLNTIQVESEYGNGYKLPVITTKQDYQRTMRHAPHKTPDDARQKLQKMTKDHFFAMTPDFRIHSLHREDVGKLLSALLRYI